MPVEKVNMVKRVTKEMVLNVLMDDMSDKDIQSVILISFDSNSRISKHTITDHCYQNIFTMIGILESIKNDFLEAIRETRETNE